MATSTATVLVVDDERPLVHLVRSYLEREQFRVVEAFDGLQALDAAHDEAPDVVVLDLMLPGLDGLQVAREIRMFSDAYIIMLTAKTEEIDRVVGLSVGADDYLTKPFSPRELVARIHAMLRRPRGSERGRDVRRFGDIVIDVDARQGHSDGAPVELTRTEFDLLEALSARPRMVWSRHQLLERLRGSPEYRDEHVIDVHVGHLRRKLDDPDVIASSRCRSRGRARAAADHLRSVVDCVDVGFIDLNPLDELATPSTLGVTRVGGIDLDKPRMRHALAAVLALAAAPHGFTVAEFSAKVHALTGQTDADYTIRQAAYDLRKLRANSSSTSPAALAATRSHPAPAAPSPRS